MPNSLLAVADSAQAILDSLSANIAILDSQGNIVRVNNAWLEFAKSNGKRRTCIGENYLDTCRRSSSSNALAVAEGIEDVITDRLTEYTCEYPCDAPTQRRWFRLSCTALVSDSGREVIVAHHDITALKMANENAAFEQSKMKAIFRAIADSVIICNSSGLILLANRASERLLRTMQSALIGQRITDIICTDLSKLGNRLETKIKRGDDSIFHAELAVSICQLGSDALLIVVLRDITERVEMQEMMAGVYSTVCHELRSPLASIIGGLSLIDGGIIDAGSVDAKEMINAAVSSADRLANLITTYLDRESIIRSDTPIVIASADAAELLRKVKVELTGMAGEANILIKTECDSSSMIDCDFQRIHQVLVNLCSNAIKYSLAGGTVRLVYSRSGNRCRFSVQDFGRGIPAYAQSKIFEPFAAKQLKLGQSLRGPSSVGLGLSISHSIVEAHGGTIGVDSTEGQGSTFWFEFPLAEKSPIDQFNLIINSAGPRSANGFL